MRKLTLVAFIIAGCGYTLKAVKEPPDKTIYVLPFQNRIEIQKDAPGYNLYYPGLEIELEGVLKERFRYGSNILPTSKAEDADLILEGTILNFDKAPLRYAQNEEVEEYRIKIRTKVILWKEGKELWAEEITGETTYLVSGPNAKTELQAVRDAVRDLSLRITDRVVEDW